MADDVHIKQFEIEERDSLLAFLRIAYPDEPRKCEPEFWTWHFLANPNTSPDNMPLWIVKSGGRIVGQLATIPVELNAGAEVVRAIWILDLVIDPEFRRRGLMKKLVLEAEKHYPFMLGLSTNAQHSPAMLKGLGWAILKEVPRYHKMLFPGDALGEVSRYNSLRSVVNLAFTPLRPSTRTLVQAQDKIRIVEKFDSAFDALWNEARGQWNCSVSRSASMLDWQFRRQPGKKFDVLGYYDNDKLLGYAVLFFRKQNSDGSIVKAAISDICYHPGNPKDIVDALLLGALRLSIECRVGGLVTDVLDPLLEERLRRLGFWRVKSGLLLMANGPRCQDLLYDPNEWFFTRGDSDISIFEDANL